MVGLPEAAWSKEDDDKSHLHSSSQSIQDHNSKQSGNKGFALANVQVKVDMVNLQRH
jgi:hypothetical protein